MAQTAAVDEKPGIVQRVKDFYEEVKLEMAKVTWPTMEDLKVSTKVTLFLLALMAVIIFVYDMVFNRIVLMLLSLAS